MPDGNITVLDLIERVENLERENDLLKQELDDLKSFQNVENWRQLILFRPKGESNTPIEVTWSEDCDAEKDKYYSTEEPMEKIVIGLVRKTNL